MIPDHTHLSPDDLRSYESDCYYRFHKPPEGGRSRNWSTDELEDGVSVYDGWLITLDGKLTLVIDATGIDLWDLDSVVSPDPQEWDIWAIEGDWVGTSESGAPLVEMRSATHIGLVDRVEIFLG